MRKTAAVPKVGWPAKGSSPVGLKMRTLCRREVELEACGMMSGYRGCEKVGWSWWIGLALRSGKSTIERD